MTTPHHTKANLYPLIVVASLLFATGVCTMLATHWLVFELRWSGPFRDIWDLMPGFRSMLDGNFSLAFLLEPYGGAHRMLLTKVLVWLDMRFLQGMNYTTLTTSLICLWATTLLILRAVYRISPSRLMLLCATGLTLLYLFSTTQLYNILYAQDSQWFLSLLFSLLAFKVITSKTSASLPAAFFFCALASLSNGVGILSLPIIAIYYCTLKTQHTRRWPWIIFTCAIIAFYYHSPINDHNPVYTSLIHPTSPEAWLYFMISSGYNIIVYTLKYIASPLSRNYLLIGILTSAWILCSLVILWHNFRHNKQGFLIAHRLLLLLLSWCVLSAMVTATGRLLYLNSATAERFQAIALTGQLAYALLSLFPPVPMPKFFRLLNLLCVVLLTAGLLNEQLPSTTAQYVLHNNVMAAHTAARSNITDLNYVGATLPYPLLKNNRNVVAQYNDYLREKNIGYHHQTASLALGQHLSLAGLSPCNTQAAVAEDHDAIWVIRGNPDYSTGAQRLRDWVILNEANTIVGYASTSPIIVLLKEINYTGYAKAESFTGKGAIVGIYNDAPVCTTDINVSLPAAGTQ